MLLYLRNVMKFILHRTFAKTDLRHLTTAFCTTILTIFMFNKVELLIAPIQIRFDELNIVLD